MVTLQAHKKLNRITEKQKNIQVITSGTEKLEWHVYQMVKKSDGMFSSFDRIPACDRRTSCDSIRCAMHSITW